jgi:hypothetical protein
MAKTAEAEKPSVMAKREELTKEVKKEREERLQRCKAKIEAVLKEENCILTASVTTEMAAPDKFILVGNPGIRAL